MKIAILVDLFPPKWVAGTEIATYHMAKHLARCGHEVHVITSLDEGQPEESYERGFYIHRLHRTRNRFISPFVFCIDIVKTVQRINPDIVHAQSLAIAVPSLITKKFYKIPYVVWGQGSDVYLPEPLTKMTSRTVMKNADSVIALTEDMKQTMWSIYDRDIVVIPNGVELKEYTNETSVKVINDAGKRILFVGRLHQVKGVRYLLQAMKIVHKKMHDVQLILVGDGEEREHLEFLTADLAIKECVEFAGKVPHEKVQVYMNQAEVFVLPSLSEGFPVTIIEAMACGLPIVATRVRGVSEIIEDGINGYLVDPKDPVQIARALLKILDNEYLRKEMSSNNREEAKKYSWDEIAVKLEKTYQNTLRLS